MEKRIEKLESHFDEMQKVLFQILGDVKSINQTIGKAMDLDEKVIRLDERQNNYRRKLEKLETDIDELKKDIITKDEKLKENINGINLKIAMVSGGWMVVLYFISKIG